MAEDAPALRATGMGGELVRCVACGEMKPKSAFGLNQLRRRIGIERCVDCVSADNGSIIVCSSCHEQKRFTEFSKKQLAFKPGAQRCKVCIEESTTSRKSP